MEPMETTENVENPHEKTQEKCSKKKIILIEYPGLVKNVDKCLETLGGVQKISETFCNEKKRLELKFSPENYYSKPVFGDEHSVAGILLKIRLPRRAQMKTIDVPSENVKVVATIETSYKFTGLCDMQYLPIVTRDNGQVDMIYKELLPTYKDSYSWLLAAPNIPYFLPPLLFSRTDTVQQKIFRSGEAGPSCSRMRKKRSKYHVFSSFNLNDPLPEKMNPTAADMLKVKFISTDEYNIISGMFQERPIWSRIGICYESKVHMSRIRTILPTVAFYFTSGPWRGLWCRFGYDPRKHFESRHYQMLDYRLRNQVGARINLKSAHQTTTLNKASVSQKKTLTKVVQRSRPEEEKEEPKIYSPYFEIGKMPEARQVNYQYCDIRVPEIQEMLEKLPGPMYGTVCTEKSGWLPAGFELQCREIMNEIIREHFQTGILKRDEDEESIDEISSSDEDSTIEEIEIEDDG
ncbi:general transcription factor 3C polypeptide 5 [Sergentomyia squamirostris]